MMKRLLQGISPNIVLLGLVSFLTDTSSEMIMPILPMFITTLGGAGLVVGLIGGLGDGVASILKVFGGYWSDRRGRRKVFVFSGYGISAICKLFFPLSTAWQHLLALQPLERVGKGMRTAPRDAIIADYSTEQVRGRSFGLHRAMDTLGAVLGSSIAFALIWFFKLEFRPILLIAAIVAFIALVPLCFVREERKAPQRRTLGISLAGLSKRFRSFLGIATLFALGNFTCMFFILRAKQLFSPRLAVAMPVLLYILFNIVYALFALPAGILSDRFGRRGVLAAGYLLFALSCLGFALVESPTWLILFFSLLGLSYAAVEGNQRAYASDLAAEKVRGTALGTFHTAIGLASLPAGLIAGALWDLSSQIAFIYGAIMAFLAVAFLMIASRETPM